MPGLFSRLKARDSNKSKKKNAGNDLGDSLPSKPQWDDAYTRKTVEPEEIHELLHYCTEELKARALDLPFLLLPFRPTSDPSAVRTFIRHFFDQSPTLHGEGLIQELRMTEPMVIAGVVKWCWSRLQGGVVGWDAYELFKVGESDSNMARDSFKTFIPISVENGARQRIIFDFYALMAALAAHGKVNGFGGRKLSRLAAWWAFEHKDTGSGFEGGYNAWLSAADATTHLFFAYLRSLSPDQVLTGISMLPMSLQKLLQETEYPPQRPDLLMTRTDKVVMIVDTVSPTPFALLRRANHFQYRESDKALKEFSEFEDPVQALTEECRRVLKAVSAANQSQVSSSKHSTSLRDASWSRFEDIGFGGALEEEDEYDDSALATKQQQTQGLRSTPASGTGLARPTTPSWADFLSTGFVDDHPSRANVLLPPDKVLPPIDVQPRQRSSQSHHPRLESDNHLEPGELASITKLDLDEAFWWVWMSSLAPEEPSERKAAFGRCAVVESKIRSARWLIMEEMVAGAAPEPQEGAYIAEKKGFFSWTKRGRSLGRRKSTGKHALDKGSKNASAIDHTKTNIGPDTHARIQAKAAQLRAHENQEKQLAQEAQRRGRNGPDGAADKTASVYTDQPMIMGEASAAMKWAKKYDKGTIKEAYMANTSAGRGVAISPSPSTPSVATPTIAQTNGAAKAVEQAPQVPTKDASPTNPAPSTPAVIPAPEQKAEDKTPAEQPVPEKAEVPAEAPVEEPKSPVPPPKDEAPAADVPPAEPVAPAAPAPAEVASPGKTGHKKLHKESKEKSGTLKKLFSRRNRASKLPKSNSTTLNSFAQQGEDIPESVASSAVASEVDLSRTTTRDTEAEDGATTPRAGSMAEPTYDPSVGETLSRVDTQDAAEANKEFSKFDQGPLTDAPAFVPESDEDDATPPPIARRPVQRANSGPMPEPPEEKLSQSASPGVQDRWAQIRKNAAERAAARQGDDFTRTRQPRSNEDGDDTSGEETIESRVARIKARVAELTGNMENTHSPNSPQQEKPSISPQ